MKERWKRKLKGIEAVAKKGEAVFENSTKQSQNCRIKCVCVRETARVRVV